MLDVVSYHTNGEKLLILESILAIFFRKGILLLVVAVLSIAFVMTSQDANALTQRSNFNDNHYTALYPGGPRICGDHVCGPDEYDKMQQALAQAQMKGKTNTTPSAPQVQNVPQQTMQENKSNSVLIKPTIILVHGAWADGTSWQHVIPLLEQDGYNVIAVNNPLTSLADDIAMTKRVIDNQKGPIVVVGHSYGGAVITGAAYNNTNVKALVYVAAFAPDSNETLGILLDKFGPSPLLGAIVPDASGFLYLDRSKFHEVFAKDVPDQEALVMAAAQKPINGPIFTQKMENPAWKTIPSWYLVAKEDQAIKPELQQFMAKRIGAKISEIESSHVAYISHPDEVVKLIEEAARS